MQGFAALTKEGIASQIFYRVPTHFYICLYLWLPASQARLLSQGGECHSNGYCSRLCGWTPLSQGEGAGLPRRQGRDGVIFSKSINP